MRPGVSAPPVPPAAATFAVDALNVWSATVLPGWLPDAPYAPRRRNWFSQSKCGKKLSSEMMYETLAFG